MMKNIKYPGLIPKWIHSPKSRTDPKMDTFAKIPANPEMYLK